MRLHNRRMKEFRICDSHCHIFPRELISRAVHAVDTFYQGLPAEPQDGSSETLIRGGMENGISHFVVCAVATNPQQVSRVNRYLALKTASSGGRFTGLGSLFPMDDLEQVRKDLEELKALGLQGVKLHPDLQKYEVDCPEAMNLFEMLEEQQIPVCVHTGDHRYDYSNPERVSRVLEAFPRLTFIGAHLGGWSVWKDAKRLLPDHPTIIEETSSSFVWLKPEEAKDIIRAFGSERVMFGTDYPMWQQKNEINYLLGLDLQEEEYQNIFWNTCNRIWRLTDDRS